MVVATMPGDGAVTNISANAGLGDGRAPLEARDLVLDVLGVEVVHLGHRLRRVGDLGSLGEAPQELLDQLRHLLEVLADLALGFARRSPTCARGCRSGTRRAAARRRCRRRCRPRPARRRCRARPDPSPPPWWRREWPRRPRAGSAGRSAPRCAAGCRRASSGFDRGCGAWALPGWACHRARAAIARCQGCQGPHGGAL